MMDHPRVVQHVGDLECVLVVLERSPPHLFVYLFLFDKERNEQALYRPKHRRAHILFIIIIIIIIIIIY